MVLRLSALVCSARSLTACSTTQVSITAIEIPVVCHKYISPSDVEEIRALVTSRADIRKPLWGITCDERGQGIAESGPRRDGDISSFVSLTHRHRKWHIIKIAEGPVVLVTQWIPYWSNQALQLTADRREAQLYFMNQFSMLMQLDSVSGS